MAFLMKYEVKQKLLTKKTKRRSGILMPSVKFIVSHDTGNDGSTALGNVSYYERSNNEKEASAHTFIDDKDIIECIPLTTGQPEKAWHVLYNLTEDNRLYGGNANDIAAGVELCYSYQKGSINNKESYKRYVWYHAYLCFKYNIDPKSNICGHNELDPSRKTDPFKNALKIMNISKSQFIEDIVNEYDECTMKENQPMTAEEKTALHNLKEIVEKQTKIITTLNSTLKTLQERNKMPQIPEFAKEAVEAAVKAGLVDTPEGGSYDFYRLITVLHRKEII